MKPYKMYKQGHSVFARVPFRIVKQLKSLVVKDVSYNKRKNEITLKLKGDE